ncbi:hypothetical protein [Mediterraneibacter faecis]|uniref:hypothetical protein n=1 Tax=Mediterraneibacter faecis TaxID=592978 RepID=UPI0022E7D0CE|nr:hypothetical protein [Mediterraneibacter faecis]
MERTAIIKQTQYKERIVKIESPNNDAYEKSVKVIEKCIEELRISRIKAYKNAENVFID